MIYFGLSIVIVIVDQFLKSYMSELLPLCEPGYCNSIEILPIFQFTLMHNSGAAFSFLSDAGGWQRWFLVTVSTVVSLIIGTWLFRVMASQKILSFGLALVLGGALGNLIDRAFVGYVVDFIVVHWEQYYFPAFNIADGAIFVGACFFVLDIWINRADENGVGNADGQKK